MNLQELTNPPFVTLVAHEVKVIVQRIKGRFPFNQKFRKFGNCRKLYRNFQEKFPEILETVEFPKCEPLNRIFYLPEIPEVEMYRKVTSGKILNFRKVR